MEKLLSFIPFLITKENKTNFNYLRLLEAAIIAVVAGILSGYTTVAKLEVRLNKIESQVEKIYTDIYKPIIGGRYD